MTEDSGHSMDRKPCIDRMRIEGFRSFRSIDVSLRRVSLLIGRNGSGKSTFLRVMELMNSVASGCLSDFVSREGGADAQLYGGHKRTSRIVAVASSGTESTHVDYEFSLRHAYPDDLVLSSEVCRECNSESGIVRELSLGPVSRPPIQSSTGVRPPAMVIEQRIPMDESFLNVIRGIFRFRFHEVLNRSRLQVAWDAKDHHMLRQDAANIAAVLLYLKRNIRRKYDLISHLFSRVVPTFDRFHLEENFGKVVLKWKPRGLTNTVGLHHTSSTSVRFLALVTLLNLPKAMLPRVLLIDQPELGIFPNHMELLCAMIEISSHASQIVLATQSPQILDHFGLDGTIIFDNQPDGNTRVQSLFVENYQHWLDKESPSELWLTNVLGGKRSTGL